MVLKDGEKRRSCVEFIIINKKMAVNSTEEDSKCCSKLPLTSVGKLVVITEEGEKELKSDEVEEKRWGGPTLLKKFVFFQKWTESPDMRSARLCVTRKEMVSQQPLPYQNPTHFFFREGRVSKLTVCQLCKNVFISIAFFVHNSFYISTDCWTINYWNNESTSTQQEENNS